MLLYRHSLPCDSEGVEVGMGRQFLIIKFKQEDQYAIKHNQMFTAKYISGSNELTDGQFEDENDSYGAFTATRLK